MRIGPGALLVALLAAGCASRTAQLPAASGSSHSVTSAAGSSLSLAGVIGWIDAPTDPPPVPGPPPPPPRPVDARPCAAQDVAARVDGPNGAGGHSVRYLRFRNISSSTCVLKGYPRVTASEPGLLDVIGTDGSFFSYGDTANLLPGQDAQLGVETDTYCAARPGGGQPGPLYHHLQIEPPGGGRVALDQLDGFDPKCGLHLTKFFVPESPQPEPRTAANTLRAAFETPDSVAAGAPLIYVVDLTNPTDRPITLSPCPAYLQSARTVPTPTKDIEALNCTAVGAIAAHDTIRFEMHLSIPRDTPAGPLKILWELTGPGAEIASASIEVSATHTS